MFTFLFEYIVLGLNILIFILHCFGFFLLMTVYKNGGDNIQLLYLLHLSVLEAVKNFLSALNMPVTKMYDIPESSVKTIVSIQGHISNVVDMANLMQYVLLLYMITDRLLEVKLNIKYPVYWNLQKAQCLMTITWAVLACCSVIVSVTDELLEKDVLYPAITYIMVSLDFIFITASISTFGFIFYRYVEARQAPIGGRIDSQNKVSLFRTFTNSKFFISCLLIVNFLLLKVIPDLIYTFYGVASEHNSYELLITTIILASIADLIDVFIYVLMQERVKRLLRRRYKKWFSCCVDDRRVSDNSSRRSTWTVV